MRSVRLAGWKSFFAFTIFLSPWLLMAWEGPGGDKPGAAKPLGNPRIDFVIPIWDSAPHNAFTDLYRYKGYWYCVFREGNAHGAEKGNGSIRIIRSCDTSDWESVGLISDPKYDLRDPKLAVAPNGKLMMHYMAARLDSGADPAKDMQLHSRAIFTDYGYYWTNPKEMNLDSAGVAWRVTWADKTAYTIAHDCRGGCALYKSKDGIDFKQVYRFDNLTGRPSEGSLLPLPNNQMMVVIRRETDPKSLYLGTSAFPYTDWKFKEIYTFGGGPNLIMLPDSSIFFTHRSFTQGSGRLCLSKITNGNIEELILFNTNGDNGYAGMYWHEDALWMSFYSSHEGKAKIYITRVPFDVPKHLRYTR
jgi:hypothetical protein